jgi:ABC-2 type transport system permease protein
MTAQALSAPRTGWRRSLNDALIITWRNLKRIPRIPELAAFAILQSIMFVLLFAFVFGGAIPLPGYENDPSFYREFLLPGIFAQTVAFAAATTAIGITDDINKGIMDRFRSLPMARSGVLVGRILADVVYNAGILIVLMLSGLLVGWTVRTDVASFLAGVGLLLLFAMAMSAIGVWLGMQVPTVEVANQVAFTTIFPITFLSTVFVPPQGLPDWLRPFAEWNPVSTLSTAIRELWGNPNPFASTGLQAEEPVLVTLGWLVLIVAVFTPLAIAKYRSISR